MCDNNKLEYRRTISLAVERDEILINRDSVSVRLVVWQAIKIYGEHPLDCVPLCDETQHTCLEPRYKEHLFNEFSYTNN